MPLLGALIQALLAPIYAFLVSAFGAVLAARIAIIVALGGVYVAAVGVFTAFISPLFSALFSTSYGQFIGLAFPPIAGTVLAGYAGLWAAIVAKSYYSKLIKAAM